MLISALDRLLDAIVNDDERNDPPIQFNLYFRHPAGTLVNPPTVEVAFVPKDWVWYLDTYTGILTPDTPAPANPPVPQLRLYADAVEVVGSVPVLFVQQGKPRAVILDSTIGPATNVAENFSTWEDWPHETIPAARFGPGQRITASSSPFGTPDDPGTHEVFLQFRAIPLDIDRASMA